MPDLSTRYLGLNLKNPLVPAASPLSRDLGKLRQMEDAGAGAVVLHSLFEEQIAHESQALDYFLTHGADSYAEALSYFPEPLAYRLGPQQYLEHIQKAKTSLGIPVIASLNGISTGGWSRRATDVDWIRYARLIQEAGADALELNLYFVPTDPELGGDQVEDLYADLLIDVKRLVDIPVSMKLGPYFSSFANMARRLNHAGADGLVLFNRFYQPDLDIENLEVTPHLVLSSREELRLPLRWIAILYGRVTADLALTTGVHQVEDVIKGIMAGASVTMMASALLRHGIGHLGTVREALLHWMEEHEYESLTQMRGSLSQKSIAFPAAYERAQYVQIVGTLDTGR
ncbi:MAG TPA: dihydroorotate dehydrogenase-like protein [Anaerolineales bacterium]|nr:dihydroorotate dehydrogenase-like protein [Anaerolineales bacterium]